MEGLGRGDMRSACVWYAKIGDDILSHVFTSSYLYTIVFDLSIIQFRRVLSLIMA